MCSISKEIGVIGTLSLELLGMLVVGNCMGSAVRHTTCIIHLKTRVTQLDEELLGDTR